MPLPPHWSESIEWRPGRWDPMSNAPAMDAPLTDIRVRDANGRIYEPAHWAQGGGEEQPPFRGWFVRGKNINYGVDPVEWQPLRAQPTAGMPADERKPWERTDWNCARARVDQHGMHCPENKCADCPNRNAGVMGKEDGRG